MKLTINPNVVNEGNQMEILQLEADEMEMIVRCNNCGKPTKYGMTRMCSGFVGCDNKIKVDGKEVECYFDDLMPRVIKCKESSDKTLYELYRSGKVYRWRDGADGGINDYEKEVSNG